MITLGARDFPGLREALPALDWPQLIDEPASELRGVVLALFHIE